MSENQNTKKSFFGKLLNGDFGLAKTYWLYGVLVNVVLNFVGKVIPDPVSIELFAIYLVLLVFSIFYAVVVFIGIWRAANKYKGPKIWAVLAKIMIVLGMALSALPLLALLLTSY